MARLSRMKNSSSNPFFLYDLGGAAFSFGQGGLQVTGLCRYSSERSSELPLQQAARIGYAQLGRNN